MNNSIWTIILHNCGSYRSVIELGPRDYRQAKKDIETKYPGNSVVAIVAGRHSNIYTFSSSTSVKHLVNDTFYDGGNQPTGGSD